MGLSHPVWDQCSLFLSPLIFFLLFSSFPLVHSTVCEHLCSCCVFSTEIRTPKHLKHLDLDVGCSTTWSPAGALASLLTTGALIPLIFIKKHIIQSMEGTHFFQTVAQKKKGCCCLISSYNNLLVESISSCYYTGVLFLLLGKLGTYNWLTPGKSLLLSCSQASEGSASQEKPCLLLPFIQKYLAIIWIYLYSWRTFISFASFLGGTWH